MFASNSSLANAYAKVGIETGVESADPYKLTLMLYDGALMALALAKQHMQNNNVAEKCAAISKAMDIITAGLAASLEPSADAELVGRLQSLYDYMAMRLVHANLHNQEAPLDEVSRLLGELRSAWAEIAQDPAVVSQNRVAA